MAAFPIAMSCYGTRESHPHVHDLQHPRLSKPFHGLQIMDTQMGFPCPFRNVVIDSISLWWEKIWTFFLQELKTFSMLNV